MYRKYGTLLERAVLPKRPLYTLQLALTWLQVVLVIIQMVIYFIHVNGLRLYGFNIVWGGLTILSWLWSLYLVCLERYFALPSVPTGGHGLILLIFWTGALVAESILFINFNSPVWFFHLSSAKDKYLLALFASRFMVTSLLFLIGLHAPGVPRREDYLLGAGVPYTLHVQSTTRSPWTGLFRHQFRYLLLFLWPKNSTKLQFSIFVCFGIMIVGRVCTPIAPIMQKKIVDGLVSSTGHPKEFLWMDILIYVSLLFLFQGANSLMANVRSYLWLGVQQYTTKATQVSLYAHLHSLSISWHLSRKTGEVLKVLDRGTSGVQNLCSYLLFQIFPALTDIVIAFGYFTYAFNLWFALVAFVCMGIYLTASIVLTEWRTKFRHEMNHLENAAYAKSVDALLNFETVKYYNAEEIEVNQYSECIAKYQNAEWKSQSSLALLNIIQGSTSSIGTLIGALLCAYMIYEGTNDITAGDYVLFIAYNAQLYAPLTFLGTYYRMIQQSFTDMENMFELLDNRPEVVDHHEAVELKLEQSQIEFRDVCFSYNPERTVLKHISFVVPHKHTVALVGHTGSGKSTILRLLLRFYDVQSGSILIDGQNISAVTQRSLRSHIGVVPQDTVLFNMSIRENIRYGRPSAPDEDVEAAAAAADLHHSIFQMPDKYETVVGERGLKLSGGEKQRVAIARTILKAPSIIVLDEATSALDTQTERNVQKALNDVLENRTSIVIAHRLSTIINANQIIVLEHGEIVEQGTHEELLSFNKKYASMWRQQQAEEQLRSEREAGPSTQ